MNRVHQINLLARLVSLSMYKDFKHRDLIFLLLDSIHYIFHGSKQDKYRILLLVSNYICWMKHRERGL